MAPVTERDDYALIDCGRGRRLDAFGSWVVDRPAPGADAPARATGRWPGAAVYRRGAGWRGSDGWAMPDDTTTLVAIAGVTMEVRPADSGAVGLFPEHALNAGWVADAVAARLTAPTGRPGPTDPVSAVPEVLNLFAYTGLLTLVAARAGARVTHVDASRPSVSWARRNAQLSGLEDRPVRWIVDDALAFLRREARRGRRYEGLILDPPSYGHGARGGGAWQLDERIGALLAACRNVAGAGAFWLLTAHSPGWDPDRLAEALGGAIGLRPGSIRGRPQRLVAESGATLELGASVRFDPLRPEGR
jgi:23S rRNA (cytosine1962-C5)-methyltransferase